MQKKNKQDRAQQLTNSKLVDKLVEEARLQAKIHQKQLLPKQVGSFAWIMINYPWQSLLVLSLITAVLLELV